jgi:hypothetical protein
MANPSVVLLPQWQGTVSPAARQLVSGAERLADLVQDMGAMVLASAVADSMTTAMLTIAKAMATTAAARIDTAPDSRPKATGSATSFRAAATC